MYGPTPSTNYTQIVEDQDDSTRIAALYYCVMAGYGNPRQHFRGFKATLEADTGTFYQQYGTLDSPGDICEEVVIDEEIVYVEIFSDRNDIEGIVLTGHLGTVYTLRANGQQSSPTFKMAGRPIGFGMYMGYGGTDNQPLQLSIFYNACNCPASTFMGDIQPRDMETWAVSGPADIANLVYQENYMEFIYGQDCGSYTVTLSPNYSFLLMEKTGSTGPNGQLYWDKLTLSSNDPIDIGQYDVLMTISQESANGDGYTNPTVGQMPSLSYTFKATINPCTTSLAANLQPTVITYVIGSSDLTDGTYSFTQSPNCNYGEFVELTNLPFFALHNKSTNDFTIFETANRALAGQYTVSLRGYVMEPDDYTMTTYTIHEVNYDFIIDMQDPCTGTILDPFTANNMQISVHGPADVELLSTPLDSIAKLYGDLSGETYCGPKSFTITSVVPATPVYTEFLNFDTTSTPQFTAMSTDPSHQGTYTVNLEIAMDEFPNIKTTASFTVEILACQVSSMIKPPVTDQEYVVYTPQIDFTWSDFDISPCVYPLDYTYSLKNTATGVVTAIPGPTMLSQSNSDHTFHVYSTDPLDVGLYEVIVTGTTPAGKMVIPYSEDLVINLEVVNACPGDVVTPTSTIDSFIYNIGIDGTVSFNPTWTTLIPGCPVTYEIKRVISGVDNAFTATETAVLTYDSTDGSLDVLTSDTSLDSQVWTIKLYKQSTYGATADMDGIYLFDITFQDPCWYATLTAAVMPGSFTWDLWQAETMTASAMINAEYGINCGGYTYELEYMSGPLLAPGIDPMSIYTMTESGGSGGPLVLAGTPFERTWLGTHVYRLKCLNGHISNAPAGDGFGIYNSVYSNNFYVRIIDPCLTSIVNHDNGISVSDIDASNELTTLFTASQNGPKDSAADAYGDGYDKCQFLNYQILDSNQGWYDSSGIISVYAVKNLASMDTFNFAVENYPGGYIFTDDLLLKISLSDYEDTATPALLPFSVTYRTCRPDNFAIVPVEDRIYYINQNSHMVQYEVDQYPCDYVVGNYRVTWVNTKTGVESSVPDFITTGTPTNPKLWYQTFDNDDVGEYTLRLYGSLYRRGEVIDTIWTDFLLTVMPVIQIVSPTDSEGDKVQFWDINLEDQEIDIEEKMLYPVDIIETPYGQEMEVTIDYGTAKDFVTWDDEKDVFVIHEGDAEDLYVGKHEICMNVAYFNSTYREEYNDCFTITILPREKDNSTWTPPDQKPLQPPIANLTRSELGLELGPYNPHQPIPYIADLTVTGVLTIGWDRTMTERTDFELINPARVAIKDKSDIDKAESQKNSVLEEASATVLWGADIGSNRRNRRLYYRHEGWYKNETTTEEEWLLIVEALELKMEPGDYSDELKLNLTWEMLGFNQDWIFIQLYFEYPERVSEYVEYDTLAVYFWGVDWFRSSKGEPVRYGTRLARPILRQVSPKLADSLGVFGHILAMIVALLMLLSALLTGRLLPTWMFLNSLQLISHLPLLKTEIQAPAAFFIYQFQDLAKLNLLAPLFQPFAKKHGFFSEGALNMAFEAYGYPSMYLTGNMPFILIMAMAIFVAWAAFTFKGLCVRRCKSIPYVSIRDIFMLNSHGHWMVNFAVRFFYEVFLVACISALISLRKETQEHAIPELNKAHDPDSDQAIIDRTLAAGILVLCSLFIGFAFVRVARRFCKPADIRNCLTNLCSCCNEDNKRSAVFTLEDSQQVNLKELDATKKDHDDSGDLYQSSRDEDSDMYGLGKYGKLRTLYHAPDPALRHLPPPMTVIQVLDPQKNVILEQAHNIRPLDQSLQQRHLPELSQNVTNEKLEQQFEGGQPEVIKQIVIEQGGQDVLTAEELLKENAKENIREERIRTYAWRQQRPMTRTLGYGLNMGKTDTLAEVHVLIFLTRRLVFALCIVLAYDNVSLALTLLLTSSVAMISLLSQQAGSLWEDYWIAYQYLINEVFLILFCIALIVLSNAYILPYAMVDASTEVFIAMMVFFIIFNCCVLVYDLCMFLRLHMLRMRAIVVHRRTRYTIQQVNRVTEEAQAHLLKLAAQGVFSQSEMLAHEQRIRKLREKARAKHLRDEARREHQRRKLLLEQSRLAEELMRGGGALGDKAAGEGKKRKDKSLNKRQKSSRQDGELEISSDDFEGIDADNENGFRATDYRRLIKQQKMMQNRQAQAQTQARDRGQANANRSASASANSSVMGHTAKTDAPKWATAEKFAVDNDSDDIDDDSDNYSDDGHDVDNELRSISDGSDNRNANIDYGANFLGLELRPLPQKKTVLIEAKVKPQKKSRNQVQSLQTTAAEEQPSRNQVQAAHETASEEQPNAADGQELEAAPATIAKEQPATANGPWAAGKVLDDDAFENQLNAIEEQFKKYDVQMDNLFRRDEADDDDLNVQRRKTRDQNYYLHQKIDNEKQMSSTQTHLITSQAPHDKNHTRRPSIAKSVAAAEAPPLSISSESKAPSNHQAPPDVNDATGLWFNRTHMDMNGREDDRNMLFKRKNTQFAIQSMK